MLEFILPIRTVSEANSSEHWLKKAKRHTAQKNAVKLLIPSMPLKHDKVVVVLSRRSPRSLDYDNLVSSLKWIRDSVADKLVPGLKPGRADSDPRITWAYDQQPSKTYSVKVQIGRPPEVP